MVHDRCRHAVRTTDSLCSFSQGVRACARNIVSVRVRVRERPTDRASEREREREREKERESVEMRERESGIVIRGLV